jgi:uncharacterized delta-60 repeat protein
MRVCAALLIAFVFALPIAQVSLAVDGDLDPAFGTGGIVITSLMGSDGSDYFYNTHHDAIKVLSDGKILASGVYYDGDIDGNGVFMLYLARFCADGKLDNGSNCGSPAFGTGGITRVSINTINVAYSHRTAAIFEVVEKIILVGSAVPTNNTEVFLARFNADGSLDTSFTGGQTGHNGLVYTEVYGGDDVYGAALLSDGKIAAGGMWNNGASGFGAFAVQYNADGTLDTNFDSDGKKYFKVGAGDNNTYSFAAQPDDKLLLGGRMASGEALVIRLNTDGSLDTTFNSTGYWIYDLGPNIDTIFSLKVDADGKILAAGYKNSLAKDYFLLRLNSNGTLDDTFDGDSGVGNGVVVTPVGSGNDSAAQIMLQADQKILVGGTYDIASGQSGFGIVRYLTDGKLDTSFGSGGMVKLQVSNGVYDENSWGWGRSPRMVNWW